MEDFLTDVTVFGENVRETINRGPITNATGVDLPRIIFALNQVLAVQLVCVLRYKRHFFTAEGLSSHVVAEEFLAQAGEESEHAKIVASRIQQLGGKPNFEPDSLTGRSRSEYDATTELDLVIKEDLLAARAAIEIYEQIIEWLGEGDVSTKQLLVKILQVEIDHAEDIEGLLSGATL